MSRINSTHLQLECLENRSLPSAAGAIHGLYNHLLHRTPSPSEVQGWVTQLTAGTTLDQVARGFVTSHENRALEVRDNYRHILGREASE